MADFNKMSEDVFKYVQELKLEDKDPVILFAVAFALLAVLIALRAIRVSRVNAGEVGVKRISYALQDLSVKLNDYIGRSSTTITRLNESVSHMEEKLAKLDSDFGILAKTSLEEFKKLRQKEAKTEKKTELIEEIGEPELLDAIGALENRENFRPLPAPTLGSERTAGITPDSRPDRAAESDKLTSTRLSVAGVQEKTESLYSSISTAAARDIRAHDPAPTPSKYVHGLEKTRRGLFGRIKNLISQSAPQDLENTFSFLEEILLTSDLGVKTTKELIGELRERAAIQGSLDENDIKSLLRDRIRSLLFSETTEIVPKKVAGQPLVILVVGVNGVGKTTTIGKLAENFSSRGARVMLAACDTFRAAAVDQISIWAERTGVVVVRGEENAKPATVAYQAIHQAQDQGYDVVIIDTAGRLHTRVNLMNELNGLIQIVQREQPGAPHETILVVDATTGQNALQQAREFHAMAKLTGVVVTKLDGTPKGGIVVAIKQELGIPIRYVGIGEGAQDLRAFSAGEFVDALFFEDGAGTVALGSADAISERGRVRRRRRDGMEKFEVSML